MRTSFLPFHRPDIGPDEIAAVLEVLRSGWLTTGPKVKQFEADFGAALGTPHAIAVNSCTAALHLALEACGIGPGDEVIVPTLTFTATAEVVTYLNAIPVLVDTDPRTGNLTPALVERAITPRTRAVIPVHFAGQACEMAGICEVARRHGVRVIEDAAHAFPAAYDGRALGTWGDVGCFSFYSTKTITTGEGGMAVTHDRALADRMRLMSLHGISKDAWKRYAAEGSWFYEVVSPGFKYNLTDIAAALGIEQLKRADAFRRGRAAHAAAYTAAFGAVPELETPHVESGGDHAWHLYVLRIRPQMLTIDRDRLIDGLKASNIGTSVHFIPLHRHPYYRDRFGHRAADFPVADDLYERSVSLPLYPTMTCDDVQDVIDAVLALVTSHRRPAALRHDSPEALAS